MKRRSAAVGSDALRDCQQVVHRESRMNEIIRLIEAVGAVDKQVVGELVKALAIVALAYIATK